MYYRTTLPASSLQVHSSAARTFARGDRGQKRHEGSFVGECSQGNVQEG